MQVLQFQLAIQVVWTGMDQEPNENPSGNPYRQLPGVDALLKQSTHLLARWGHTQVAAALRGELDRARQGLASGDQTRWESEAILARASDILEQQNNSSLKPVMNLSGTVLHTNLGRASLPEEAIDAVVTAARQPCNVEFDLASGQRGDRESHIEELLCELTGAEAATAVNNNAAAVLLVLNTLALGGQVPVSRGELVEIGGSFRIPEIMQRSGSTLVEIGATNRTHLKDYQQAINPQTALLMKVHTSNYRVEGFTKAVSETALAELAHQHHLPFVIDLGSGSLVNFAALGLPAEPTAAEAIANGADIITFSGDKLVGGPQAGLIAGRRELITQIRENPLKRALRLDKMTLAALAEVLKLYRYPESLTDRLPTLRQLTRPLADIKAMARRLEKPVGDAVSGRYKVSIVPGFSQIGSGALPIETLPTSCLQLSPIGADDEALRSLASTLRQLPVPIVGRLNNGALLLDLRCLDDENLLLAALPALETALA
jgi:L-seryl-tRNA(Ser) seleniumtransferase